MSEYQYYEFQALDRPLISADQSFIQGLSSRVELTVTNARFVYKGVRRHFDSGQR